MFGNNVTHANFSIDGNGIVSDPPLCDAARFRDPAGNYGYAGYACITLPAIKAFARAMIFHQQDYKAVKS